MNQRQPLQIQQSHIDQFEFYFVNLNTQVLVENRDNEVVIRATRNAFSERRKVFFIHELAAEGFIPDIYARFSSIASTSWPKVRWLIDTSWLQPNTLRPAAADRFMIRLLAGAVLLWLGMMVVLFAR